MTTFFQVSSSQQGVTIIEPSATPVQNPLEALKLLNGRQVRIDNHTKQSIKTIAWHLYQECQRDVISRSLNYLSRVRFLGGIVEAFAPTSNVDHIYQEIIAREDEQEVILDETLYVGGDDGEYVEIDTVSPQHYLYFPDWQASLLASSSDCNGNPSKNIEDSPPHSIHAPVGLHHLPLIDTETESVDADSELEAMMCGCKRLAQDQQPVDFSTNSYDSFGSEDSLSSLETVII